MGDGIAPCPHCGAPSVERSGSKPGTFVCRACTARYPSRPKKSRNLCFGVAIGFLGSCTVSLALVLFLIIRGQHSPSAPSGATNPVRQSMNRSLEGRPATEEVRHAAVREIREPKPPTAPEVITATDVYERSNLSVVTVIATSKGGQLSQGSGFCVSKSGIIVSNLHVVEDSASIEVVSSEGWRAACARFVGVDPVMDLVLLKIDRETRPLTLVAEFLGMGSRVYALGSPQGFQNSISDGVVSGRRKIEDLYGEEIGQLIQTTAAISPGSSGGPLLSGNGEVVGVTSCGWADGQNLNFAIPAMYVQALLDGAHAERDVAHLPKLVRHKISRITNK